MAFASALGGAPLLARAAAPARALTAPRRRRAPPPAPTPTPAPAMVLGLGRARDALRARGAAWRERLWRAVDAARAAELRAAGVGDFRAAAAARDRAHALRGRDPFVRLQRQLAKAVAAQRFGRAARLRDALARVPPPPVVLAHAAADFGKWRARADWADAGASAAAAAARGVDVRARASFDRVRSGAQRGARAVFRVRCRARNASPGPVQIVGRRWAIAEFASGATKAVEGCGVGAKRRMPVLAPGDEFEWETAVPVAVLGLAPVQVPAAVEDGGDRAQPVIAVGSIAGALEVVGGDVGECAWDVPVGETLLMLPA